jgi:hypothetical protein
MIEPATTSDNGPSTGEDVAVAAAIVYDVSRMQYRNTLGHFVGQRKINQAVDAVIASGADTMRALTTQLQAGAISLADWQAGMMSQMKLLHLGAALVGRGGRGQMSQADWGWTGQRLRTQYAYLREFAHDIALGSTPMDGRLIARAAMYAEAARGTHQSMMRRVAMLNGREEERNYLGVAEQNCVECIDCTAQGWVDIGTLPPIGGRKCLARCHCTMSYRGGAA